MYVEGLTYCILIFLMPLLNLRFAGFAAVLYLLVIFAFSGLAAFQEKRSDLLLTAVPSFFLFYVNAYVFLEQFVKEVILRRKSLSWFTPKRMAIV